MTIGGSKRELGICGPLSVHLLSVSCSFRKKNLKIIGFLTPFKDDAPIWEILDPLLTNNSGFDTRILSWCQTGQIQKETSMHSARFSSHALRRLGGCLLGGVSASVPGGGCLPLVRGVCLCIPACTGADTPTVNRMTDRQAWKHNLSQLRLRAVITTL